MPSKIQNTINALLVSLPLATLASTPVSANEETSKLTEQKQAELNKLIAEAVKKAGIELDEEELTIVIVKKPGDEKDTTEEPEVISEISAKEISEQNTSAGEDVQALEDDAAIAKSENEKAQEIEPSPVPAESNKVEESQQPQVASSAPSETTTPEEKASDESQDEVINAPVVATSSETTATQATTPVAVSEPAIKQVPAQATNIEPIPQTTVANSVVEPQAPEETNSTTNTVESTSSSLIAEQQTVETDIPQPESAVEATATEEIISISPSTTELEQEVAKEAANEAEKAAASAVTTAPAITTEQYNDDYYGNYISPNRQQNAYYSSDLMEAINSVDAKQQPDLTIPSTQIANLNSLSVMESSEMSNLVVEGALDSTAAGDVSTTTLKTALVIPDDTLFDDIEKEPDEDIEEIKKALSKKDLSKRVRETLDILGANQNRGNSNGRSTAGTMAATNVQVTATVNSRQTDNSISSFSRPTNLNNTTFR